MAEKAAKRKKGGDDDDDMAESDDEDLPRSAPAAEGAVDDAVDDGEDEVNSDDEEAEVWKVRAAATAHKRVSRSVDPGALPDTISTGDAEIDARDHG